MQIISYYHNSNLNIYLPSPIKNSMQAPTISVEQLKLKLWCVGGGGGGGGRRQKYKSGGCPQFLRL